jgi:hypothetical protein
VQLNVTVPVVVLSCSGRASVQRIEKKRPAAGPRFISAAVVQSKGGHKTWSRVDGRGKQEGVRGTGALVFTG